MEQVHSGQPTFYNACRDLRAEVEAILEELRPTAPALGLDIDIADIAVARKSRTVMVITNVIFFALLGILVLLLVLFNSSRAKGEHGLLGYTFEYMETPSMQSEIAVGSLVVTHEVDPATLIIGDDISFYGHTEEMNGFIITHKIVDIIENYNDTGERGFITRGVNNARNDDAVVPAANIVGKVVFYNHLLGEEIHWIQEHMVLAVLIVAVIGGGGLCLSLVGRKRKPTPKIHKEKRA